MVTASIGRGSIAVWDASPRAWVSWRELIAVWDASSYVQPPENSFGELGGGIMVTASIGRGSIAVWDASPRAWFSWWELIAVWDASS